MAKFKIGYCAGHGKNTPGKRTPDGEREWVLNNKVVVAFEKEMKKYDNVELHRYDDPTGNTDVSLTTRTNKANKDKVDIYISFHHNASGDSYANVTGVETFTQEGVGGEALKLAKAVHPGLVKAYGLKDRGLKTSNLHITRETNMPAILIEGGFMNGKEDIKKLRDDKVLAQAGINIAQGTAKYLGLKLKKVETPKKAVTKPKSATNPKPKAESKQGTVKVLADSLYYYNKPDWNAKAGTVKKNEVFTVVDTLTVKGSKLYKLKSGTYLTANPKYVKFSK